MSDNENEDIKISAVGLMDAAGAVMIICSIGALVMAGAVSVYRFKGSVSSVLVDVAAGIGVALGIGVVLALLAYIYDANPTIKIRRKSKFPEAKVVKRG